MDTSPAPSYWGYRFPVEIISQFVCLYFRFCLSFRDVQEMMLERGAAVSPEAIRLWCLKFGVEYARHLRHRRGRCWDTWFLDEVFCKINGQLVYLWRAVDQEGEVLDILVQSRRNANSAKRFFKRLLKGLQCSPRAVVTDKLSSYVTTHRDILSAVEHRRGGRVNDRSENTHQPTHVQERRVRRFKSMKHARRFLSTHEQVSNHFRSGSHLMRACHYRNKMVKQFAAWRMVCGLQPVAQFGNPLIRALAS